jgi:uridine phosphorylase
MVERDFVHRAFGGEAAAGDIAPSVVLTTSRDEVRRLAATWQDTRQVADHYAFLVWTGTADGIPVTACSTGTGSASAAIAIEELAALGARTLVGVGTTREALAPRTPVEVTAGWSLVVAEGAVRHDAASAGYARPGYPAAPHIEVVMAAVAAGRAAGARLLHEVVADIDAELDACVGVPPVRAGQAREVALAIRESRAVPVHGSAATLFILGAIHGLRTGFLAADAAAPDPEGNDARLLATATATLVTLATWDRGDDGRAVPFAARFAALPPLR